ncbi:MAG TPA: DNA-binding protein WhiA [bacterium]|nr:DNA-binding protein WhiA [bacterium]HPO83018.1 DNA-binding protein WhiA [bacterium]
MERYSESLRFELCKKVPQDIQEAIVELQGIVGSRKNIKKNYIYTDRMNVANRVTLLWKTVFNSTVNLDIKKHKDTYRFYIKLDESYYDLLEWKGELPDYFLRGVFIACGFISDPEKGYRIELIPINREFTRYISKALDSLSLRYNVYGKRVYINGFSNAERFLSLIGVQHGILQLEEVRTMKLIREDTNRRINFQGSNIEKTLRTSDREIDVINRLMESGRLPERYIKVADLRLRYPHATLSELAQLSQPPVSKSTMAYYMKRLEKIANAVNKDRP